jgi:hypothetical protein
MLAPPLFNRRPASAGTDTLPIYHLLVVIAFILPTGQNQVVTGAKKAALTSLITLKQFKWKNVAMPHVPAGITCRERAVIPRVSRRPTLIFLSCHRPARQASLMLRTAWQNDASQPVLKIRAGTPQTFHLQPFEVPALETL